MHYYTVLVVTVLVVSIRARPVFRPPLVEGTSTILTNAGSRLGMIMSDVLILPCTWPTCLPHYLVFFASLQLFGVIYVHDADTAPEQSVCTLNNGTDVPVGTEVMESVCRHCICFNGGYLACYDIDCPHFFHPIECPAGQELRSVPGQCCRECQGNVAHRLF